MRKTYKLELEVTLDEVDEQKAIQVARDHYRATGGAKAPVDNSGETWREISAEEAVPDAIEAIMELIGRDALSEQAGIEVVTVSCDEPKLGESSLERGETGSEVQEAGNIEMDAAADASVDEFETGMYLCRWPNGDFSLVRADTRRDALLQLDEWAAAHPSYLSPLDTCMVDFHLNDLGEIVLEQFGEETEQIVWNRCYPELDRLLSTAKIALRDPREYSRETKNLIRKTVRRERTRLWANQPECPSAKMEAGRDLQKQMGMVGPVADYYIEQRGKRILESKAGENRKPN